MKYIIILLVSLLLSSTAAAAELNISEAPNSPVETIVFENHTEIPDDWFPLRKVSEYLPIEVSWNAEDRAIVIDSEPNRVNWPWLAHSEILVSNINQYSNDLKIINGVTYCSPWFLIGRMYGVSFVHEGEVWYCNYGLNFDGNVNAAMLRLQVVAPDEYKFVVGHLTGGIKIADEDAGINVMSYVYPYSAKPVCYINDTSLNGAVLASTIAHEAYHVYHAKNGMTISEREADIYEKKVFNILMREQRIWNGTLWMYE